jgi:hypothetical protein
MINRMQNYQIQRSPEKDFSMSKNHYHAVIWIDHHEARVFHFCPTDVERLVLHPDHPTRHIHHKANSIGSGTPQKITIIFTQSVNRLQTPVRCSLRDQPMQRLNWSNTFITTIPS